MDGVLVIDKPKGLTSHDVVLKVRRVLDRREKVGHLGTLDPIATGVLPICIGKATRLSFFLMKGKKEYIATMKLGEETDTLDSQGNVIYRGEIDVDVSAVDKVLQTFKGRKEQVPPSYSAIKRDGIPLYKLARKGIVFDLEPREVFIYDIALLNISLPFVTFRVITSPGTYVRSLCRDIGRALGCYGYMYDLRRIRSGEFSIEESLPLHNLSLEVIEINIVPMNKLLFYMPYIEVDRATEDKIRKGIPPRMKWYDGNKPTPGEMIRFLSKDGRLLSIAKVRGFDNKGGLSFCLLRVLS